MVVMEIVYLMVVQNKEIVLLLVLGMTVDVLEYVLVHANRLVEVIVLIHVVVDVPVLFYLFFTFILFH